MYNYIFNFIKNIIFSSLYTKCVFFQYVLIILLIALILGQKFSEETKGGKTGYIPSMHPFAVLTYVFLFLFIINSLFLNLAYKKEYSKYRIADVRLVEEKNDSDDQGSDSEYEFEAIEENDIKEIKEEEAQDDLHNQEDGNENEDISNELEDDEKNQENKLFEDIHNSGELK